MFINFMFIPANNIKYIKKSETLANLDNRIFDLEDSILESEFDKAISNISDIKIRDTDWIRLPIEKYYQHEILKGLVDSGINNFVIPKFEGFNDFRRIQTQLLKVNKKIKTILLIENASSYIDMEKILKEYSQHIYGISLGIHDFSFNTGVKNDYKTLKNIRLNIMLLAKTYSVIPIDIVSIYLTDKKKLVKEIIDGFNIGYRAKLLIHPKQLEVLKRTEFYSSNEIDEFKRIVKWYHNKEDQRNAILVDNGRIYEKMHINEIEKVIKWGEEFYESNR